jgi:molecular chaperone GrpE
MHEAVQKVGTSDYPDGTVVQEVRKGYLLNGKVLRPSLVKVAFSRNSEVKKVNEK